MPVLDAAIAGREVDPITFGELRQFHCAPCLGQEVQAFDHHPVEVEQVFFTHVAQGLGKQLAVQNRLLGIHRRCTSQPRDGGCSPRVYGSVNHALARTPSIQVRRKMGWPNAYRGVGGPAQQPA